jgi:hypothetical protein
MSLAVGSRQIMQLNLRLVTAHSVLPRASRQNTRKSGCGCKQR